MGPLTLCQAPEVFRGEKYNHKADVFSFAIVCYELLHRRLILSSILEKHFGASHHVIEKVRLGLFPVMMTHEVNPS